MAAQRAVSWPPNDQTASVKEQLAMPLSDLRVDVRLKRIRKGNI
jgi:hypothetical protein